MLPRSAQLLRACAPRSAFGNATTSAATSSSSSPAALYRAVRLASTTPPGLTTPSSQSQSAVPPTSAVSPPTGTSDSSATRPATAATAAAAPTVTAQAPVSEIPTGSTGGNKGGNGNGGAKKPKRRLRTLYRTALVTAAGVTAYIVWHSYDMRHPGDQLPHDPSLPTVVVLGNGWGSTAFLKDLDNEGYNVVVISPRNYFLFTPLLPSVTVGTLEARSILEPTRFLTRHLKRVCQVYEGEVSEVDPKRKTVTFIDPTNIQGDISGTEIKYDYLVYAVGAENNTFGIPGVKENACFLKEIGDAEKLRNRLMDSIESANFAGQTPDEVERLLSFVVVGGGPTGVEYAGELHDFVKEDLANWYPELASKIKITLIEALPNVLPMFSKQLIDYTMSTFKENKIEIATKTMVKEVKDKVIVAQNEKKELVEYPYGLLVWATGNTARSVTKKLMTTLSDVQTSRRGLLVDDHLRLLGAEGIFALGDCTATSYAPTAQAASQQGRYLARVFSQLHKKQLLLKELEAAKALDESRDKLDGIANAVIRASSIRPFHYSHQGSLAYIGSDKAIADLPFLNGNLAAGGLATYYFWRSAYLSQLFSLRNRILVATDWIKCRVLGRDVSRE